LDRFVNPRQYKHKGRPSGAPSRRKTRLPNPNIKDISLEDDTIGKVQHRKKLDEAIKRKRRKLREEEAEWKKKREQLTQQVHVNKRKEEEALQKIVESGLRQLRSERESSSAKEQAEWEAYKAHAQKRNEKYAASAMRGSDSDGSGEDNEDKWGTLGRMGPLLAGGETVNKEEKWSALTKNLQKSKEETTRREHERIEELVRRRDEIRQLQKAW